jgi:S1-C subfamily serine protease
MKALRISTAFLFATAIVMLLASFGGLDIQLSWRGNDAQAIDFFNEDDNGDTAGAEPFWSENGAAEPIVPNGVPASFAELAERVSPGVVNIATSRTVVHSAPRSLEEFFFGMPFGANPHFEGAPRKIPSLGSGFVISEDGYIVTNNHVIENVDKITVIFADNPTRSSLRYLSATRAPRARESGWLRSATPLDWSTPSPRESSARSIG